MKVTSYSFLSGVVRIREHRQVPERAGEPVRASLVDSVQIDRFGPELFGEEVERVLFPMPTTCVAGTCDVGPA
jgi:hypothetical protein